MENYILSLIKENNRVIVPNFGAFIVAKENGFSVLFNNFLSFNDGLLVDYIVTQEGINKDEAELKVDNYVEQVKATLDSDGSYSIAGLGTFTKDAAGILRFEQNEDLTESTALAQPTSSTESNDDLLDIDSNNDAQPSDDTAATTVDLPETTLNDEAPIAEIEEEKPEPEERFNDETKSEETTSSDDPVAVANKYIDEDNSKRNRSIVFFLSFFILLPLIGFSVYFFLIKDNSPAETQKQITQEIKKVEPTIQPANDANIGQIEAGPDTTTKKEIAQVEEANSQVEEEVISTVYKPHQLIVGSFSSEANAQKMVDKLATKGFDKSFFFQHNNRFLVSLESFEKVHQAQAKQEDILQNKRMESWIITKRQ